MWTLHLTYYPRKQRSCTLRMVNCTRIKRKWVQKIRLEFMKECELRYLCNSTMWSSHPCQQRTKVYVIKHTVLPKVCYHESCCMPTATYAVHQKVLHLRLSARRVIHYSLLKCSPSQLCLLQSAELQQVYLWRKGTGEECTFTEKVSHRFLAFSSYTGWQLLARKDQFRDQFH